MLNQGFGNEGEITTSERVPVATVNEAMDRGIGLFCCIKIKDFIRAFSVLDSVPVNHRTANPLTFIKEMLKVNRGFLYPKTRIIFIVNFLLTNKISVKHVEKLSQFD